MKRQHTLSRWELKLGSFLPNVPGPDIILMLEVITFVTGHVCLVDDKSFRLGVKGDIRGRCSSLHHDAAGSFYACLLIRVQQDLGSENDCKDSVTQHFGEAGLGCLSCRMKSVASGHDSLFLLSVALAARLPLSLCYVWAFPFCFSVPQGPYSQIGLHWSDKCFANVLKHVE